MYKRKEIKTGVIIIDTLKVAGASKHEAIRTLKELIETIEMSDWTKD